MRYGTLTAFVLLLTVVANSSAAQELRFSTENDIVTNNPTNDDQYTFSVALEVKLRDYELSLRENAFTDRAAGTRFDETYLSVGRPVLGNGPWNLHAEVGIAHVGRGLLGERAQNVVHRMIDNGEVHLRYLDSSLHPRVALVAKHATPVDRRLAWSPRVEVDLVPGLRSWGLLAAEVVWRAADWLTLEVMVGDRFTEVSSKALAPYLAANAPAAGVGAVVARRLFISWSYNQFGDEREHLTLGYRFELGRPATAPGDH